MYKPVPSKVDFPAQELDVLRFWDDTQAFAKRVSRNVGGPRFSFIDGPITANNPMGVHHAWGRTYKDIFCRYHAMLGQDQRYQNDADPCMTRKARAKSCQTGSNSTGRAISRVARLRKERQISPLGCR